MNKKYSILFIISVLITFLAFADSERELITGTAGSQIYGEDYGIFNEPWAMTFLPGGELLVTEKSGRLYLFNTETRVQQEVEGVPEVAYGGQGGLGDIIIHPDFSQNRFVYFSFAEEGTSGTRGAAVARARLQERGGTPVLENLEILWRQTPKVRGNGHYSHRLLIDPQGYLFITSGERQKQDPAQDWEQNLGKIIRLRDDGSLPQDNPFQNRGELAKTFWTLGHRNLLGIALDGESRLWAHEMGPRHGDELNLIVKGVNYGWPLVSWGNHYSGADIADHDTRPEFRQPAEYWIPSIAPSGLVIYQGRLFESWQGNALIGGLVSKSLVRVEISGERAEEVERFNMNKRIREVEQGPDGALWILEDREGGRLRRLTPNP